MNDYKINDFGKATFIAKKGFKYETEYYGIITAIEPKVVEFTDNDGTIYIISKANFKFEVETFINKTNNL